jgi:hypothetical protein
MIVLPPPPLDLIKWNIKTIKDRELLGLYTSDGWLEWLEQAKEAILRTKEVKIEILAETDITDFIEKVF